MMASPDIHTLSGAYALDALPEDEQRFFEAHLEVCDACRSEVAELQATAAKLAAVSSEPAPPSLRERVLAEIDTVRQEPSPPQQMERAGLWERARGALLSAAAAALIVIVGLTAVVARMNTRIDQLEARNAEVYEILAAQDAQMVTVEGQGEVRARFVVSQADDRAMMIAQGLPPLDRERVYQLWFIDDSGAQPAGLFRPRDDGRALHVLATSVPDDAKIGITVEPAGGSLQPTTDPILVSGL
ncbi:MAG: anti-sigma factor domain-containing protein [Nitriliruptorales bacterium]